MHLKCWKRTHDSNFFGTFSSQRKHQETIRHCVWLAGTFDMCDIICHTKFHIISRPYRILNWQLCVWQRYFLLQVSPPAWSNFSLSIWPFFFFWQLCALILQVPLRAWSEFCVWNVVWIFKMWTILSGKFQEIGLIFLPTRIDRLARMSNYWGI